MYKFAAASENESIVFGSARPRYSDAQVNDWIEWMKNQGIQRVCCLLASAQLNRYTNLLGDYRQNFGSDQVCWTPMEDFHLVKRETLVHQILPFLATADQVQEKVVIHCSGGIGRTGQVLAAWLVYGRAFSVQAAINTVRQTGKDPYEAAIIAGLRGQNPWAIIAKFNALLEQTKST